MVVERLTSAGEEVQAAIGSYSEGTVSIELDFVNPLRPIGQLRDRGTVHRFDEGGFAFRKRCETSDSGLLLHCSTAIRTSCSGLFL